MYIPEFFKNENIQWVNGLIRANRFGIVNGLVNKKAVATHVPLLALNSKIGVTIYKPVAT